MKGYLFLKSNEETFNYFRIHKDKLIKLNHELSDYHLMVNFFLRCIVQGVNPKEKKITHILLRKKTNLIIVPIRKLFYFFKDAQEKRNEGIYCGPMSIKAWTRNYQRLKKQGKKQCVCLQWENFPVVVYRLSLFYSI